MLRTVNVIQILIKELPQQNTNCWVHAEHSNLFLTTLPSFMATQNYIL